MKKNKSKKSQLYAVIGLGRFGFALAESLSKRGLDVIAIDRDRAKITAAAEFTQSAFVVDELTADNLREVGVVNADVAVVCIGSKLDTSVLTTMNLMKLGVKKVISKATSTEQGEILKLLGAEVVYPEHDMAIRLAARLASPNVLEYISLSDKIDIAEIQLSPKVDGKTVLELNVRRNFGLNIIAISDGGEMTTDVLPDTVLKAENTVTVIGQTVNVKRFEDYLA
ncbi:MAG: TrkA family potassium uptake protein [Clostridia bacterium]|nr:TrkA family potassium uptake protein [Clostridia bacterium]